MNSALAALLAVLSLLAQCHIGESAVGTVLALASLACYLIAR